MKFLILFFFLLFLIEFSHEIKLVILNYNNEITIKLKGKESQYILNEDFPYSPNEIIINGQNSIFSNTNNISGLSDEINEIKMIWENNIDSCYKMFYYMPNILSVDFSEFDSSNVTDMSFMFQECSSLTSINFLNFDTSQVTDLRYMFSGCISLESLDLSSFNTEKVINMGATFQNCILLKTLNLNNFITPSLESLWFTFYECNSLENLEINNFNTEKVWDMSATFYNCYSLQSLNLSSFKTLSLTTLWHAFYNCSSLKSLDLSHFNTEKVTNMDALFKCCSSLKSLDLDHFIAPSLTSIWELFYECQSLEYVKIPHLNTEKVQDMGALFLNCYSLTSLDLSTFNTNSATTMGYMFYNCTSLISLDLSSFNTQNVENLEFMFYGCNSLTFLNLNNFNTSLVTTMTNMFYNCSSLESLEIKNFNTNSVIYMDYFFYNCSSLKSLDVSNFNTECVITMENMFFNCQSLISLNLSNFDLTSVFYFSNMFYNLNENFTYCYNKDYIKPEFQRELSPYENDCEKICILNSKKYIYEKGKCVLNCSNEDDLYKFEYNSKCYSSCPNGTHNSSTNDYLCEEGLFCDKYYSYDQKSCLDIMPDGYFLNDSVMKTIDQCNIKCDKCNLESQSYNLCITCNYGRNYYPKFNDPSNYKSFINCYRNEEPGYYLDFEKKMFYPCCNYCEKCNDYSCIRCFPGYILKDRICILNKNDDDISIINNDLNSLTFTYSYSSNLNMEYLKDKMNSFTFIDISQETIEFFKDKFDLNENETLTIVIDDFPSNDTQLVTSDYNYRIFLENGTELDLEQITEDNYVDIYVPIKDFNLSNFNTAKYFAQQGYDIYNLNDNFYNDICSPVKFYENDLTLEDRLKDIYPSNIIICKGNCYYNGLDIENERFICKCNINKKYSNRIEKKGLFDIEDGNFFSYFLDYLNYKIFKCYKLISAWSKINKNYSFYTIIIAFFILLILNLVFIAYNIPNKKAKMIKNFREQTESKKNTQKKKIIVSNESNSMILSAPTKKKKKKTIKISRNKRKQKTNKSNKLNQSEINNFLNYKSKSLNKNNYNELPFTLAINKDKRNIIEIFYSVIRTKFELLNLIFISNDYKIILICDYILSLLVNFFFNALLYSDRVISTKYHNNGKLDFIVRMMITLLSNIITSIILYYLKYSEGLEEREELINELKNKMIYLRNVNLFIKLLILRFFLFLFGEIITFGICFYYIVIFCVIYSLSKYDLLINYLFSIVESIVISIILAVIITLLRKIGLMYINKYFYNTSKFIDQKF